MSGVYSVLLLVLSNIFMTFAWYGHLKLSETGISKNWPLIAIIAFSWGIAFLNTYAKCLQTESVLLTMADLFLLFS